MTVASTTAPSTQKGQTLEVYGFADRTDVAVYARIRAAANSNLSRPSISLWEHRLARRRLRAKHRGEIDEAALFAAVEEMRAAERDAARLTRSARRDRTRRARAPDLPAAPPSSAKPEHQPESEEATAPGGVETELPRPFDDIEQW